MNSRMLTPFESNTLIDPGLAQAIQRNHMHMLLHQQEMASQAAAARAEFLNHRRFMRLYTFRHFMFRLAPRFATRFTL